MKASGPSSTSKTPSNNDPTIISYQQSKHPGMTLAPPVEQLVERHGAERIRGGCCLCPGGSVWTCSSGGEDDDQLEKAQQPQQEQRAQQMMEAGPSQLLPALNDPRRSSQDSQQPLHPRSLSQGPGSKPPGRMTTSSLPAGSKPPPSLARTGGRPTAMTLQPQSRPPDLSQRGRRVPAQSAPTKPAGH